MKQSRFCLHWPWLLLIIGATATMPGVSGSSPGLPAAAQPEASPCEQLSVDTGPLHACLQLGYRTFLKPYIKHLKQGKLYDTSSRCSEYAQFQECIDELAHCQQEVRHILRHHWLPVMEHFECSCNHGSDKQECDRNLQCLETELGRLMADICDNLYHLNAQQKTRPKCHFLHEMIHCKEALVTSACGQKAGDLAFHVNKLFWEHKKKSCSIHRRSSYDGFRYSTSGEGCPRDFISKINACTSSNLPSDKVVYFHRGNDFVPTQSRDEVEEACSAFHDYKECIADLEESCPRGTTHIYDYMTDLRIYRLKMSHICDTHHQDLFLDSLSCYQEVVANNSLKQCTDAHFDKMASLRSKLTPHSYFCLVNDTLTIEMRSEIAKFTECSANHLLTTCGSMAATTMKVLLQQAFRDPRYLKMAFKPNCALHSLQEPAHTQSSPGSDVVTRIADVSARRTTTKETEKYKKTPRNVEASKETRKETPISYSSKSSAHAVLRQGVSQLVVMVIATNLVTR